LISLIFLSFPGAAQIEEVAEKLLERNEFIFDLSDLQEDMIQQEIHPVNLNSAGADDLKKIPGFTEIRLKSFLDYQKNYGQVLSYYELGTIPGFDTSFIKSLLPYVSIEPVSNTPPITPKNLISMGRHELFVRYGQIFPKSKGYLIHDTANVLGDAGYPGDPQRYYFRYTYSYYDRLRIGMAGEKDPGEQFFGGAQSSGMDYYSGFISLTNTGILKNLTIGNFRAGFGQGLTFGTGLSGGAMPGFSVGYMTLGGIKGTLSISEGNYLRGIAATVRLKKVEMTCFASYHKRDGNATLVDTLTGQVLEMSSLQESGLHRTTSEIKDRNCLSELVTGGNINFTGNFFRAGITGYYLRWSGLLSMKTEPYKRYSFYGNENFAIGFDFQIRLRKLNLFGEISRSGNGGLAWLIGLTADPDPRVKLTVLYRNYRPDYQNIFSNAFGQQSQNANEQGIFMNILVNLFSRLSVNAYTDVYRFTWLKYRVDAPSEGIESGAQLTTPFTKSFCMSLRYFYNSWSGNAVSEETVIAKLEDIKRQNIRLQVDWNPLNMLFLKSRFEINMTVNGLTRWQYGYLYFQDIAVRPVKFPVNITFRYAIFDIPGYAQRIYTYEPEVLFGYSVPAFYGKGYRLCLLLTGNITRSLSWWLRGALTQYQDRSVTGTGLDEIAGSMKCEITAQIRIRL